MRRLGPGNLHDKAGSAAEELDAFVDTSDAALRDYLADAGPDDELRLALHLRIAAWDGARPEDVRWAENTGPHTRARREVITRRLKVDEATANLFDELFPIADPDGTVVIADDWEPWYTAQVRQKRDFYWTHYADYLTERRGWSPEAVTKLDTATTHVVERLSDPTRKEPYQAKGLVVGYVQSGKTANFTGVISKAVDAGYRLVIVLTGTTNLLREQTQRRIDMELVGRENILRGIDLNNPEALVDVDYQADQDWADGRFVSHGAQPADIGRPDIHRMTTYRFDYRSLKQGIKALDFERFDRAKPLNHPDNLFRADARLVIVKKNSGVLEKLAKDLGAITAKLQDIPTLIIDDESDQASINTTNPKRWDDGKTERTSINRLISKLLGMLPRGQYVGYTATPFANVFVDPGDAQDIFPKDFLISLERPPAYMGAAEFHDLDLAVPLEERTYANSKEKAHVRLLAASDEHADLQEAMDFFVLAAAVKLFRKNRGAGSYKHHTMLVHEAMRTAVHRDTAGIIKRTWAEAGYYSPSSHPRLRELYERDLLPVSRAIEPELPTPDSFEELARHLGEAIRRISPKGNPVLVVNSDKDIEQDDLDFGQHDVWRILVGGNKLARGFTVEGLTVSYYRRDVKDADALMQMGRWFGFRAGYRDLVRLYVTRGLRDAFESICRDEEEFRAELRQYAKMIDGRPAVTPAQVPPLVTSRVLRPTAAAKMYNAVLVERRTLTKEPSSGYPELSRTDVLESNIDACVPLLVAAVNEGSLVSLRGTTQGFLGTVTHNKMIAALSKLQWAHEDTFKPDLAWLIGLDEDQIRDWKVVMPQQKGGRRGILRGIGPLSLHGRALDPTAGTPRLRGNSTSADRAGVESLKTQNPSSGVMLLYPVVSTEPDYDPGSVDEDPREVVMAIRLELPGDAAPSDRRPLAYRTQDSGRPPYSVLDEARAGVTGTPPALPRGAG
ncbi:Z1 domain-containing protein [Actinosynnema sp. NPDC023926]